MAVTALPDTSTATAVIQADNALERFDKTFPENVKAEKESGDAKIPEGWRLMAAGEVISENDMFDVTGAGMWIQSRKSIGLKVRADDIKRWITPIEKVEE